jgi:hypothetical protein
LVTLFGEAHGKENGQGKQAREEEKFFAKGVHGQVQGKGAHRLQNQAEGCKQRLRTERS